MFAPDLIDRLPGATPARRALDTLGDFVNAPAVAVKGRDLRLDMFRGLALLMIFIDHVPGTVFEGYTVRNLGFSDAAEAFVFMSGMAAGLAYSGRFVAGEYWLGTARIWARARQLYLVHVTITALAIAVVAAAALWFGAPQLLTQNNMRPLFANPLGVMIGLPLLTHQLGYFNILPMYTVLLLATPAFLMVGLRRPMLLLAGSVLLWAVSGQFRLNLPNWPNPGGWFFNPLSWQLVFVIGLICGTAMKRGKRAFPISPWGLRLALVALAVIFAWVHIDALGVAGRAGLAQLSRLGLPFYITGFDKTFLALPRLLHALALYYVISALPVVVRVARSRLARPLTLLGQHGLPVFATGSVLCMVEQAARLRMTHSLAADTALIGAGILVQLLLALALSRTAARQREATRSMAATANAAAGAAS